MGETPIYDQLRGEWINADVSLSAVRAHHLGHTDRHFLGEGLPSAAEVVGQRRRGWAFPAAGLTGDEPGTDSGEAASAAVSTEAGVRTAPRHARGDCWDGEQLLESAVANRAQPRHQPRHLLGG